MQGGVMQVDPLDEQIKLEHYMDKIDHKTANFIALSCQSAAMLGGHKQDSEMARAVHQYGHSLGLAYQLTNDLIMHNISRVPDIAPQDMRNVMENEMTYRVAKCVNTGAFQFAAKEYSDEVLQLTSGGLQSEEDCSRVAEMVHAVSGEIRTKALALEYAQKAIDALSALPESNERAALTLLAHYMVSDEQKELQRPDYNARSSKSRMFS